MMLLLNVRFVVLMSLICLPNPLPLVQFSLKNVFQLTLMFQLSLVFKLLDVANSAIV